MFSIRIKQLKRRLSTLEKEFQTSMENLIEDLEKIYGVLSQINIFSQIYSRFVAKIASGEETLLLEKKLLLLKHVGELLVVELAKNGKTLSIPLEVYDDIKLHEDNVKKSKEILRSGNKNQNREISDKALISLKNAADHTYNLLENLLYWSRSQRERLEFEPTIINVYDLVVENIELMQTMAYNKGVEIKTNISDNTYAFADNNMVKTIIRNLVFNAVKFTSEGHISINADQKDNKVYIEVVDTGVGIKEEDLKKILNTNEYYTTYGTKREKGSGLGLNLCIDFVKRNDGSFSIESEYGEGTKVIFSLPKTKS